MTNFETARTMMVDSQLRPSDVTRYPIIDAMLTIPREDFVPVALKPVAYAGAHVPLGPGRVILDPRTFGKMIDALEIGPEDLVLDIGCGLGYSTAVIARLAEAVIGVEEDAALAAEAGEALSAASADNAVITEGPLVAGDATHGPYDVIAIQGAVQSVPEDLLSQLKENGRIAAIFDGGHGGRMRIGQRDGGGSFGWRTIFDATAPVLPGFEATPSFEF